MRIFKQRVLIIWKMQVFLIEVPSVTVKNYSRKWSFLDVVFGHRHLQAVRKPNPKGNNALPCNANIMIHDECKLKNHIDEKFSC